MRLSHVVAKVGRFKSYRSRRRARTATLGAHQAEYSCYEQDGQLCAAATTTATAFKQTKVKRSGTGTEYGSHKGSSLSALFQVP